MESDIVISIRHLYKIFGPRPRRAMRMLEEGMSKEAILERTGNVIGLNDVNLDMERHKIQVVMGLSGSGKSTLIRHINRLIDPTQGQVLVDGQDVLKMDAAALQDFRRHQISMVFQRFALFPHRTIMENVTYGLEIQGVDKQRMREVGMQWIERVGLSGFEDSYPMQLSGGMQQRVGLARALATDADILLMDEAFSALDPLIRTEMQNILLDLQNELQKTIVFITHDLDEALRIGENIAILRDGVIVQNDEPQNILLHPADAYVASFMKDINRARVLQVRSVMSPPQAGDTGPRIRGTTTIEAALQIFAESSADHLIVVDRRDEVIGHLNVEDMIRGMRRPSQTDIAQAGESEEGTTLAEAEKTAAQTLKEETDALH